ncbi:MAG: carboxymuconolactone decarboxylase family protein [Acidobacteria bacterium]|nr:carboxymuconolactone decarboxylase family protein [Acidobacteriota bacterium]
MTVVKPVPAEKLPTEATKIYDSLTQKFGRVPNFFAVMANRPNVLKHFLPFYAAVMAEGSVEARYKELAYLKAATLNGCEY